MNKITAKKTHMGLRVSNIDRAVTFYEKLFDRSADKREPGYAKFLLPELVLSFIESEEKPDVSFGHFGFQLESSSEVKTLLNQVKEKNIDTLEEEQVRCCYALQDKFWVTDPDGYRWEFYYVEADVSENDPATEACCTPDSGESACCTKEEKAKVSDCC